MTTLEDKILGEKKQYYCDSSDEEEDPGNDEGAQEVPVVPQQTVDTSSSLYRCSTEPREWEGSSVNTGPKGVLKDWQRYKQLETERMEGQEVEKQQLIKKLALTCRSHLDEERDKKNKAEEEDAELNELLEDVFFKEYVQKRMQEMMTTTTKLPSFGRVLHLENGEQFLNAIDNEHKEVAVVIHLYEDHSTACEAMHGCLMCLAQEYSNVKFCRLKASTAGLTKKFKVNGVPALLVYKGGSLVGNFVRMSDEFGEDFFAGDVESFLIENGILPDKSLVPEIMYGLKPGIRDDQANNSDFELD